MFYNEVGVTVYPERW